MLKSIMLLQTETNMYHILSLVLKLGKTMKKFIILRTKRIKHRKKTSTLFYTGYLTNAFYIEAKIPANLL